MALTNGGKKELEKNDDLDKENDNRVDDVSTTTKKQVDNLFEDNDNENDNKVDMKGSGKRGNNAVDMITAQYLQGIFGEPGSDAAIATLARVTAALNGGINGNESGLAPPVKRQRLGVSSKDGKSSLLSRDDFDNDEQYAEAMELKSDLFACDEETIINNGIRDNVSYYIAFGSMLTTYNNKKMAQYNYKTASVRGNDLKMSFLQMPKYSTSELGAKAELRSRFGIKNDEDLAKKLNDIEFNTVAKQVASLGISLLRDERRRCLDGMSYEDGYYRRGEIIRTMISLLVDSHFLGFSQQMSQCISEFAAEVVDPNFERVTVSTSLKSDVNDNSNSNADRDQNTGDDCKEFIDLSFKPNEPLLTCLAKHRANYAPQFVVRTIFDKVVAGENVKWTKSGDCFACNVGSKNSMSFEVCKIHKNPICGLCDGHHFGVNCPLIRHHMSLATNITDWKHKTFEDRVSRGVMSQSRAPSTGQRHHFGGGRGYSHGHGNSNRSGFTRYD